VAFLHKHVGIHQAKDRACVHAKIERFVLNGLEQGFVFLDVCGDRFFSWGLAGVVPIATPVTFLSPFSTDITVSMASTSNSSV
jgi:hypothetical protein